MIISVTQEDIDNGRKCSSGGCAFALALKRALPETRILVGTEHAYLNTATVELPSEIQGFIEAFDNGPDNDRSNVEPVVFELDLEGIL